METNTCVPTALAQIMKYYRHPLQGTGTHSYSWSDNGVPVQCTFLRQTFL